MEPTCANPNNNLAVATKQKVDLDPLLQWFTLVKGVNPLRMVKSL